MGRHTGKLVAGFLGWIFMGLPGALLGLLVGHWFDRGLQHSFSFGSPEKLAEVQREFFNTCFLLLGHVAKADGRVSEQEINHTEAIMRQLGIRGAQRDEAIALFKRGAEQGFDMAPVIAAFNQLCAGHRQVKHALLTFLLGMAAADGHLHPAELELLRRVAGLLGYSAQAFERLVRMVEAQSRFHDYGRGGHGRGSTAASSQSQLADAYRALGVKPDCSDRELKRAYRRLMSENHPDKLIAQGVPEEMVKLATERSQEIQAAYEIAKKHRR